MSLPSPPASRVVAVPAPDAVVAGARVDRVVVLVAVDPVVAAETGDRVVALLGDDQVVPLGAGEHVVAIRSLDHDRSHRSGSERERREEREPSEHDLGVLH